MFSLKNEKKSAKIILFLCCILLLFLMIFSIFYYGNKTLLGNFYNPNNDDVKFIRSAWILATKGIYTYHNPPELTAFMMPGVSYTLALFMLIFGKFGGITAFRITQSVIQVLSLLLLFYIARKLFNSTVGIIAVILDTFYIAEILMPNLILTETFFKFFVLGLVFFSLYAIDTGKIRYYAISGVFYGLAALFRPVIAFYPILIIIMWIIKKEKFKSTVKYSALVIAIFCVIMSPWWIRNFIVYKKFVPFTLASGNPTMLGTYINYNYSSKETDGLDYSKYNNKDPKLTEVEKNQMEINISKYRLKNLFPKQPVKFIYWYTIGKGWIQIKDPFYWREIYGVTFSMSKYYHKIILSLGLLGFIIYCKDKNKNKLTYLALLTLLYFVIVYLPFYTMSRYYYPVCTLVIMFSAYFLERILKFVLHKRRTINEKQNIYFRGN